MDLHLNNALARCLNALHFITSHLNQEVPLNLEEISNPIHLFWRSNASLLQRLCLWWAQCISVSKQVVTEWFKLFQAAHLQTFLVFFQVETHWAESSWLFTFCQMTQFNPSCGQTLHTRQSSFVKFFSSLLGKVSNFLDLFSPEAVNEPEKITFREATFFKLQEISVPVSIWLVLP